MVLAGDGQRALGDVLGEIADALQVARDLEHRHDVAQVVGHRLAPGDHEDGLLLQLALELIDGAVAGDGALGELGVALLQRIEGLRQQPLGQAAHLRHLPVEQLQLLIERLDDVLVHGLFPRCSWVVFAATSADCSRSAWRLSTPRAAHARAAVFLLAGARPTAAMI